MRFTRGDVSDHIVSHKNDHGPYPSYRALQRRRRLEINFREIFGVAGFSTFATVSAKRGDHFGRSVSQGINLIPPGISSFPYGVREMATGRPSGSSRYAITAWGIVWLAGSSRSSRCRANTLNACLA